MTGSCELSRRHLPTNVEGLFTRPSSDPQQFHVLAVDDSVIDRTVIERLLKISSCKVTTVESGTRALQFLGLDGKTSSSAVFDDLKVNLIMTDYSMPGMTGYELLKKIKESSTFREIPVVIMSSENILPRIDRCLEEGAEEFIVKPVKLSDVTRLKDFIIKGRKEESNERMIKKRRIQHNCSCSSLAKKPPLACDLPSSIVPSSPASSSKRPRFCEK